MELAVLILGYAFLPGALIALGVLADQISTKHLKDKARKALRGRANAREGDWISALLKAFVTGFLERLLGAKFLSVKFFVRSTLLSLFFIVAAVAIQFLVHPDSIKSQFSIIEHAKVALPVLLILLIVTVLIDYLSNIVSFALIRMAAVSGQALNIVIVILSDVFLTLALFTMLFPIGIVGSAFVVDALRGPTTISLEQSPKGVQAYVSDLYSSWLKETKIVPTSFSARQVGDDGKRIAFSSTSVVLLSTAPLTQAEGVETYAEFLRFQKYEFKRIGEANFEVVLPRIPVTSSTLYALYSGSYRLTNITRDGFLGAARLEPINISLGRAVKDADDIMPSDADDIWYRCSKSQEGSAKISSVLKEKVFPCPLEVGAIIGSNSKSIRDLHPASMRGIELPLTPFFFSSFAISIVYYLSLVMFGFGTATIMVARWMFNSPYLRTTDKPFFILSLFAAFPAAILTVLFKLVLL